MNDRKLIATGILLGIGLGGFLDGILAHQILQMHSMLSAKLPLDNTVNLKTSMFWDGLFHIFTWITTLTSLIMLWRILKTRPDGISGRALMGAAIMGWGIFNLVEGIADHYVLQVHHVMQEEGLSVYDHAFIASGIILMILGFFIARAGKKLYAEPGDYKKGDINAVYKRNETRYNTSAKKAMVLPGILTGIGMGGILEGILFFQVFQLHNMVSAKFPPETIANIRESMFWDGLYHLFTWLVIVISVYLLWKRSVSEGIKSFNSGIFLSAAFLGLGALNVVEGIIDHHILGLHHVVERLGLSVYDYIFLIVSACIACAGFIVMRKKQRSIFVEQF